MKYILNVEGDEVAYRACFAAERDDNAPVEYACKVAKNTLEELGQKGELSIWLSPSDKSNFRYASAVTLPYKGNRKKKPKPKYLEDVRQYMIRNWFAQEAYGYEADDMLGIHQAHNTICVSQDKDLNQVEGKHLNWVTGKEWEVEEGNRCYLDDKGDIIWQSHAWIWAQALIGDLTVDNIPGIKGIGPEKAFKILEHVENDAQAYEAVFNAYLTSQEWPSKQAIINRLAEVLDLVYICRKYDYTGKDFLWDVMNQCK